MRLSPRSRTRWCARVAHAELARVSDASHPAQISLLAIAICMSPAASRYLDVGVLDEILREKHADYLVRLRRGDSTAAYEELFSQACPKFVSAANPSLETNNNVHLEPLRFQQSLFLVEVKVRVFVVAAVEYAI